MKKAKRSNTTFRLSGGDLAFRQTVNSKLHNPAEDRNNKKCTDLAFGRPTQQIPYLASLFHLLRVSRE